MLVNISSRYIYLPIHNTIMNVFLSELSTITPISVDSSNFYSITPLLYSMSHETLYYTVLYYLYKILNLLFQEITTTGRAVAQKLSFQCSFWLQLNKALHGFSSYRMRRCWIRTWESSIRAVSAATIPPLISQKSSISPSVLLSATLHLPSLPVVTVRQCHSSCLLLEIGTFPFQNFFWCFLVFR